MCFPPVEYENFYILSKKGGFKLDPTEEISQKNPWVVMLSDTDSVVEQVDWDTSKARSKLLRDLDEHIASVRAAKLADLTSLYEV